ncbi:catalytic core domain of acetyl xylan esterase from Trichoderma Reesei [Lasiosphaeris hirsuta]|uniref:Catalytic core domain of acetyl xylan esterase from Trichoderma Reesei n=1 Tax=Lasiosphaeris hirsuta TaxID=260670 RepID=A0AA40DT77_9PEZI|nr:catalytic core domain of acetyl xylan esterase from Trichoderma Reesei [Lasiosphaeris hirsuta]
MLFPLSLISLGILGARVATAGPGGGDAGAKACPEVHVFGARETTTPPGFGTSQTLIDLLIKRFPSTTAEAIVYPAAGGDEYSKSVGTGILAVVRQTAAFAVRCPSSIIIMHGYSQGAQIMDDAFCGGPDLPQLNSSVPLVSGAVARGVAAIIMMGNPRNVEGLPYHIGNSTAGGFAARPKGFRCRQFEDRIQSYCDSPDPFCSNGNDPVTHQGYGKEYGQDALEFILSKLVAN